MLVLGGNYVSMFIHAKLCKNRHAVIYVCVYYLPFITRLKTNFMFCLKCHFRPFAYFPLVNSHYCFLSLHTMCFFSHACDDL